MSGAISAAAVGAVVAGGAAAINANQAAKKAQGIANGPKYLRDASKNLIKRGEELSQRAYTPYEDQLTAGLTQNQLGGVDLARGPQWEQAREYTRKAGQQADLIAGAEWNADTAGKYMSPYLEASLEPTLRGQREAYAERAGQLDSRAASMDAFGGDRSEVAKSRLERDYLKTTADTRAQAYQTAYQQAFSGWQADNNRRASALQAYRAAGNDITNMSGQELQALMETGQIEQITEQLRLGNEYKQFIEERDWDVNNLDIMIKANDSAKGTQGSGSAAPQSNIIGDVMGGAATMAGLYGKFSGGGGGNFGGIVQQNQGMLGGLTQGIIAGAGNTPGLPG